MMCRKIRASVVQACTAAYSLPDTLDKLERLAILAKQRDGSQLAVFPEAFVGGYPAKSTFGATIGSRSAEGRDEYLRYHSAAIEIPSPAVSRIEAISRRTGVFLIVGVIEKDGGTCYCTVIFVDPTRGYIARHRKLMPTASERLVWGFGDASTLPVVEHTFSSSEERTSEVKTKLSAAICWENYMPLLRTHYYEQGTQLYCAPTVDSRPSWQHTMAHIALEGRCFVLSACQYAQQKDYPAGHPIAPGVARDPEGVMIGGGSVIYNPAGEALIGPLWEGEGVLTADIDLDDITRADFLHKCVVYNPPKSCVLWPHALRAMRSDMRKLVNAAALADSMDVKSPAKQLHDSLNLYVGDDFYSLEPPDSSNCLTINRTTGNIVLEQPTVSRLSYIKPTARVFGIVGLLSLTTSDFLILVTGRKSHGHIFGHEVYRATDFKILPLDASRLHQHPVESHLLALVRAHLSGGTFWFSYTWDLTKRLQAQRTARHEDVAKALWETADDRFFWNKFLHSRFIDITTSSDQDLSSYILPIMYGTFDNCTASINSRSFRFCLISRRSRYRAGTRYFTRGIDENGNVANFNETEQILILNDDGNQKNAASVMSFVQIRGSVPVFWAEVNNLRYTPDLQIMELQDTADKFKLHFQKQISTYGPLHVVNLVKQKGREKLVKEAYERFLTEMDDPDVKYDYFDFHIECKNMQYHRIELLVNRIKSDLVEKGYFHDDDTNSTPRKLQNGVMRTNCMDNLDRTNVVQSTLGRWVLTQQLREVGILGEKERVDDFEEFMEKFRNLWADHADAISKAYSGAGALKTDVTRTGKRTKKGMIQDGVNSITRYLKNNYLDGARQDAFDIITGAWAPKKGPSVSTSLLFDDRPLIVRSMPYVLFYSVFMVFAGLTLPRSSDYSLVYYFLIWICLASISLGYIFIHGIDYVSWPRLNPPVDVIHYDGPGNKTGRRGRILSRAAQRGIAAIGQSIRRPRRNTRLGEVEMGTLKKRLD